VEYLRERAQSFVQLANDPDLKWDDPTRRQRGQKVRVVLESIERLRGRSQLAFIARVYSPDNGGQFFETNLPEDAITLDNPIFEGFIESKLVIEVASLTGRLCPYRRAHLGSPEVWLGRYGPQDEKLDLEDLGAWRIWYRIERA